MLRDPDELADHDLIAFVPHPRFAAWALVGPGGQTAELTPTVRASSPTNSLAVREAVLAGGGIALLPSFAIDCPSVSPLTPVLPEWHAPTGELFAVYPSTRNLSPKVRTFLDYLVEHLRLETGGAAS